ncbi:MAG: cellulase family glycosylhydrolase [Paludibacteraceae bacterium]|nr:cellulase family glycosylhydrolase [Paludibacteraceae bacterium]
MKKTLLLTTLTSMTLAANANTSPYQGLNYADWGRLQLVDNQLSDSKGNPVQLKGWSTYSLHYAEVQGCLGKDQWKMMQEYGANVVRLAMYIDAPNSYLENELKFKDLLKQCIRETKELDMYCIVDWHILRIDNSNTSGDPNDYINESKDFFGEISKYCADNGYDHVLYEICNEPTCGWANIKSYAEQVIQIITANQPEAIIIVGTDQWCQKITEPMSAPISANYKKNVMYSFHYYACTHKYLLGDFRNAQKYIPVFVSEWSPVNFNGEGPFCVENSDELVYACEKTDAAPQVVSWCVWNWGKKDESSSFFTGSCEVGNESDYMDRENHREYGNYIMELMDPDNVNTCDEIKPPSCCPAWSTLNRIPSRNTLWHWDYYNRGGEYIAYHDVNSSAWIKDSSGVVVDYSNEGEEVDVFSLAETIGWIEKKCPWSKITCYEVSAFDSTISTLWKDEDGNPTYKSLNAGRMYYGVDGSFRPDEGVDLMSASCLGTPYEYAGYNSLYKVEEDEWITYTVKVEKPGYYKISGVISSEYTAPSKNGEISIISEDGNLLRNISARQDDKVITTFGFPRTTVCDDPAVADTAYWDCWTKSDAISGDHKEVLCVFKNAGEQRITIKFYGDASGVGPLVFDWYKELDFEDITHDCDACDFGEEDDSDSVDDVEATKFSIKPNPTSGAFTITLAENDEATVEVVNMAGQVVVSQKVVGSAIINNPLVPGVYTVVVKSNVGISTKKLVVK